ncbi:MAG: Gfo/Idh/MocA family protein [Armatimonadota bacterium]
MDQFNGAVIGIGGIGKWHGQMQEATKRIKVKAVCDANEAMRQVAAEEFPEAIFYTSPEEMLKQQALDVVSIATPHILHAPLAVKALEAGVNVIVEKPMATRYADCLEMIEAARKNDRFLTVFHNRRLDGFFLAAKSAIDDGLLGNVFEMNFAWSTVGHSPTWRGEKEASGGVMFDWGVHLIDYALHFTDSEVTAVSGHLHRFANSSPARNEDHGSLRIYFASGATANISISHADAHRLYRFKLLGERGTLIDDWNWKEDSTLKLHSQLSGGERAVTEITYRKTVPQAYYDNIADHLQNGAPLLVSPESAAKNINILCTAERSSRQGGIPLPLE